MKRLAMVLMGVLILALPLVADTEKVSGVSQPGKVAGKGWFTGTQAVGKIAGVTASSPVTDFTSDSTLDSVFFFENNLNDGSSHANNLTGTGTYSTTVNVQQGTYSVTSSSTAFSRTDANLSSSHWAKNTGGTKNACTICGWVRITSAGTYGGWLASKGDGISTLSGLQILDTRKIRLWFNEPSGYVTSSDTLSANTNYFVAATWNGTQVNIYYMQAGGSSLTHDTTNASYSTAITTDTTTFNTCGSYDGTFQFDEIAVFHAAKTEADLLSIAVHGIKGDR